jgi:ATP-dependent Clp endopeptidase proteolytic subunit ClpP
MAKTEEELRLDKLKAEIAKIKTDRKTSESQGEFFRLQSEKLGRQLYFEGMGTALNRIYDFWDTVTDDSVYAAVETLSAWSFHSKKPITVRFFSYGGSVAAGFALYDFLKTLRSQGIEVNTVCMGTCMSMGGILLQAGKTRYIGANAILMIHESSSWMGRTRTHELDDYRHAIKLWEERLSEVLAARSTMTAQEIRDRWVRDWYMSAQEAIELGFADKIAAFPEGKRRPSHNE